MHGDSYGRRGVQLIVPGSNHMGEKALDRMLDRARHVASWSLVSTLYYGALAVMPDMVEASRLALQDCTQGLFEANTLLRGGNGGAPECQAEHRMRSL